jgi:hypothetical protein
MASPLVTATLRHEAGALMTRLAYAKPFALHMPMVAAAEPAAAARRAIDAHMAVLLRRTQSAVTDFVDWLLSPAGRAIPDTTAQARFSLLRLRSLTAFTQFDLFSDALTQRSEHEFGVWLGGLDALAADGLTLDGGYFTPPPALCYLDRGIGAAIRRARTRLPGGGANPVALIRVPRERLIGSGIASSLIHEVGHQAAALLNLVNDFMPVLLALEAKAGTEAVAWRLWQRWLSEIIADFWSIAHLGIGSTIGLMSVVSLPRAFVFRLKLDDPHPSPWIRVQLSAAIGERLYPDAQWQRLRDLWLALYPRRHLDPARAHDYRVVEATLGTFVDLLVDHRPRALGGSSLREALPIATRHPATLRRLYARASDDPAAWLAMRPTLAFAVMGQARAGGKLSPWAEARLIDRLLTHWAHRRATHHTHTTRCDCPVIAAAAANRGDQSCRRTTSTVFS